MASLISTSFTYLNEQRRKRERTRSYLDWEEIDNVFGFKIYLDAMK